MKIGFNSSIRLSYSFNIVGIFSRFQISNIGEKMKKDA